MTVFTTKALKLKLGQHLSEPMHLHFKKGEIWGVLGPNGSGKTTFLHTLAGLLPKVAGEIYLNEKPLSHYALKSLATEIGILFQEIAQPFPQTIWEYCLTARFPHLAYFKKEKEEDREIVLNALKKMQLLNDKQRKISNLSGGEKKRTAIAALLSQTPFIYLLDEPSNHLDLHHQITVLKEFSYLAKEEEKIVLMSLHDINLAERFCDHCVLFFPQGKILSGEKRTCLTEENLSSLYQCEIKAHLLQDAIFWYRT